MTSVDCPVCAHADQHGWWGLKSGTHCRKCHRTWTGHKEGHCAYCCAHFGSTTAYDRHLLVRRMTVTTARGHKVLNEEVVICRPVEAFGQPMRNGKPRLVYNPDRDLWVTERDPRPRQDPLTARTTLDRGPQTRPADPDTAQP